MEFNCHLSSMCGGCSWIGVNYGAQLENKSIALQNEFKKGQYNLDDLPNIKIKSISFGGFRDVIEFIVKTENGITKCGLYSKDRNFLVDIDHCSQMSADLSSWYKEFKAWLPPIKIGSFRLRVSSEGKKGVWLDLPNIDIKYWLDEFNHFNKLLNLAHVEIGQKRKKLVIKDGRLALVENEYGPWFDTFDKQNNKIPLHISVGSFSQPSREANKLLVSEVRSIVDATKSEYVCDLFSGAGNFSLAIHEICKEVIAVEWDDLLIGGFKTSIKRQKINNISIIKANLARLNQQLQNRLEMSTTWIVDPPRSGLMKTLDLIKDNPSLQPTHLIYVSCFADSLVKDVLELVKLNYKIKSICLIDQFPQTPHAEYVVHLQKQNT